MMDSGSGNKNSIPAQPSYQPDKQAGMSLSNMTPASSPTLPIPGSGATQPASSSLSTKSHIKNSRPFLHFAAGMSSGLISAILLQPVDLLKTRVQQLYHPTAPNSGSAIGSSLPRLPSLGTQPSLRTVLGSIFAQSSASSVATSGPASAAKDSLAAQPASSISRLSHSLRELWRGTAPSTIRTGCGAALYFGWLDLLRRQCVHWDIGTTETGVGTGSGATAVAAKLTPTTNLFLGGAARAAAGFVMMPVTVIKVHMESSHFYEGYNSSSRHPAAPAAAAAASNGNAPSSLSTVAMENGRGNAHPTIRSVASHVIRTQGFFRGLFAGSGVTAIRDAPYAGLYVVFYEKSKEWLHGANRRLLLEQSPSQSQLSPAFAPSTITFTSGVVAASLATVVTNPFDAIKTRLQLYPGKYRNMFTCLMDIVKPAFVHPGAPGLTVKNRARNLMIPVRTLFSGLGLRIARKGLSSAISWTVYEEVVRRAGGSR